MEITKTDLINFLKKYGFNTKKTVTITKEMASKWSKKDLVCFIGVMSLDFRPLEGALSNANCWAESTKEEILKQFFKKDYEKHQEYNI